MPTYDIIIYHFDYMTKRYFLSYYKSWIDTCLLSIVGSQVLS
mgnify:CR=1 FL=1